jgi:hypothetical protein
MKRRKTSGTKDRPGHNHLVHDAEGAASGAVAGVILGVVAGPPGMVAGAILGAAAGAVAAEAMEKDGERAAAHTRELDEEIGVMGGDLGAPNLAHPPARIGAYSTAATGTDASPDVDEAEGPIQAPEK